LSALVTSSPVVLTVFIRHFYCTSCHNFLEAMAATQELSQDALAARGVKLIVVGCGQPETSQAATQAPAMVPGWDFYTDPEGAVYDTLVGMTKTMSIGKKPGYVKDGMLAGIIKGVIAGLRAGVTKGGNPARNGGEFLWVNGELKYAHCMQNTRDHLEV
ncbi:hypothetical protein BZA77DRAFT_219138, partial [Pyronema omphalodes]